MVCIYVCCFLFLCRMYIAESMRVGVFHFFGVVRVAGELIERFSTANYQQHGGRSASCKYLSETSHWPLHLGTKAFSCVASREFMDAYQDWVLLTDIAILGFAVAVCCLYVCTLTQWDLPEMQKWRPYVARRPFSKPISAVRLKVAS